MSGGVNYGYKKTAAHMMALLQRKFMEVSKGKHTEKLLLQSRIK